MRMVRIISFFFFFLLPYHIFASKVFMYLNDHNIDMWIKKNIDKNYWELEIKLCIGSNFMLSSSCFFLPKLNDFYFIKGS